MYAPGVYLDYVLISSILCWVTLLVCCQITTITLSDCSNTFFVLNRLFPEFTFYTVSAATLFPLSWVNVVIDFLTPRLQQESLVVIKFTSEKENFFQTFIHQLISIEELILSFAFSCFRFYSRVADCEFVIISVHQDNATRERNQFITSKLLHTWGLRPWCR